MYFTGWIRAEYTFKCKWCERVEIAIVDNNKIIQDPIEGWQQSGDTRKVDICSSDCQKEIDDCINQTFADLEPVPNGKQPEGFWEHYNGLRAERLKKRGL